MVTDKELTDFINLFNLQSKKEIDKYLRTKTVTLEAFAMSMLTARSGGFYPYQYACHFNEIRPGHLNLTPEERKSFSENGIGPLKGRASKAFTKICQTFDQRRVLAVHLLYTPDKQFWHLFYFDQRDSEKENNHWKHGPHIHYLSDIFISTPLDDVWATVNQSNPKFTGSKYVRFDYTHNRSA